MQKDIITKERMVVDYQKRTSNHFWISYFIGLFAGLFMCFIFCLILIFLKIGILGIIYSLLCLSEHLFLGIQEIKIIRALKKGECHITTEKMVGNGAYSSLLPFRKYGRYLSFLNHSEYFLPPNNYFTSELFRMDKDGVLNYSNPGDIFYLVIYKDKKIVLAYNTKMFELKE